MSKKSEFFFTGVQSDLQLTYKYLARICTTISKETGIKFTPRALRHTAATMFTDEGLNLYMLSRILGHSDIKTTTIYQHTGTESLKRSVDALEMY